MRLGDQLRPPAPWDPSQEKYKDWLHLNVFDHETGAIGLINASLHGAPLDPRSRVLGTAVANVPGVGWLGNVEVSGFRDAAIDGSGIGLPRMAIAAVRENGAILASVRNPGDGFEASISAFSHGLAIDIEEHLPLADGWISWYVIPRLRASGTWTLQGNQSNLEHAGIYHDHNWGRWYWGDDFGWEWGCFLSSSGHSAFVVARTTNRAHTRLHEPSFFIQAGEERRAFGGPSIDLRYEGDLSVSRRLPGAMAALHQDHMCPRLPRTLTVQSSDGIDDLQLRFIGRDALQLIAADPIADCGYTFIHEIAGEFSYAGKVGGAQISGRGLGIIEYVC